MRHVATRTATPSTKVPAEGDENAEETVATAAGSEDTRLQALYEQIAWPLAEKYGHTYEAFKVALT
jgi:translation initiation factor 2 subunit 1